MIKHVNCADLVPQCTARFEGESKRAVVELYADHARHTHAEPVLLLDLMLSITAA